MTEPISLAAKDPDERYRYSWTPAAGDTISGDPAIVVIEGGATLDGDPTKVDGDTAAKFNLVGGVDGETTMIRARATMSSGDIVEQTIFIPIRDSSKPRSVISLAEAKLHLRVDASTEDATIADALEAACEWVENYTGMVLKRRQVIERISQLVSETRLRAWPVDAAEPITLVYRDSSGSVQTIADAEIRASTRPAVVYPAADTVWPASCTIASDIDATFTAGFADPADVPATLKQAMLVMLTAFYDDREGGSMFAAAEDSAKRLCRRHKRRTL